MTLQQSWQIEGSHLELAAHMGQLVLVRIALFSEGIELVLQPCHL
jgi:hypothetical protein